MQPKERLGRGGHKWWVRADAKQVGMWRKAPTGDMQVQEPILRKVDWVLFVYSTWGLPQASNRSVKGLAFPELALPL